MGPFPHQVRDARQQKGGRPGPVGHVSSSYPSRGPSCSHGSDVAPVDKDQQAGPVPDVPHVAPADGWQRRWRRVDYGLVEIK